ncbi:hypothetical protein [Endosaccharibacter trunci]
MSRPRPKVGQLVAMLGAITALLTAAAGTLDAVAAAWRALHNL